MDDPPLRISIVGSGDATAREVGAAEALGRALGRAGAVVVSGGRGGVMEAASRGCVQAGGWTVGLLPGPDPAEANPWIRLPIATGMGEARNVLVVRAGEAVVAVGGAWGTLSEVAVARKIGRDVGLLEAALTRDLGLPALPDAGTAATWALERADEYRTRAPSDSGSSRHGSA